LNALAILAQTTAPAASPEPSGLIQVLGGPMFPLILGILVLYIFVFRSKKKQERQKQDLLKQLTRGQKVQTIGGIIATVVEASENSVLLKVDETNNTKVRFSRSAIHRVITDDDKADAK
jgi:preprotein translocase subunit YajC